MTAVRLLEQAARESDLSRAAAARGALTNLADDDSRRVSDAARTALQLTGLRPSASSLDLGQVTVGETARSSAVKLEGPPLALGSPTLTVTGPLNARVDGATVLVTWTPTEPGSLDAAVTVSGPGGEVRLAVTGKAAAPKDPVRAPRTEAATAIRPESRRNPLLLADRPPTGPPIPSTAGRGRLAVFIGLTVCGLVGIVLVVVPIGLVHTFLSGAATTAVLGLASVWNLLPRQGLVRRWVLLFVPAIPVIVIGAYAGSYGLYFVASGRDLDGATLDTTVVDSNGYLAYRALLVVLALGIYAF